MNPGLNVQYTCVSVMGHYSSKRENKDILRILF